MIKKWEQIPLSVKILVVGFSTIVASTVFVVTYHDQFVTSAEAADQKVEFQAELVLLRVDMQAQSVLFRVGNKESEKRALTRDKGRAIEAGNTAEAAKIGEDIQTLRDQIEGLCDQIEDC